MSIAPMPVAPVSLAQAGEVVQWGSDPLRGGDGYQPMAAVPASLSGVAVTQVALAGSVGFAVTASGRLESWGGNQARLQSIPAEVAAAPVAQVATNAATYAGVVTRAGEVRTWGIKRAFETPLDVPQGLTGVKQLAFANQRAFALRNDGTVVAWGQGTSSDPVDPPAGLRATALAVTNQQAFALTVDGAVVGWDKNGPLGLSNQLDENVVAIAASVRGVLALLADGTLVNSGSAAGAAGIPAGVTGSGPVSVVGGSEYLAVVDSDGVVHHWDPSTSTESGLVPSTLNGRAISQLALSFSGAGAAVVTKMLRGDDPQISGSAVVGQTLTATPGTFSSSPEAVTGQWLVGGAPIAGASGATLPLTAALVGKAISYQSTATKTGETTISSASAAVTVTNPPPPPVVKVASKSKVAKVAVAKKAAKVSVTGKVTASKSPAGKAKVTIKKGKKVIVTKTVKVSAKGAVTLTVKKFSKLVAKKLKAKGKKAKTAYRGKYVVTIAYAGNGQVKASNASKAVKIR